VVEVLVLGEVLVEVVVVVELLELDTGPGVSVTVNCAPAVLPNVTVCGPSALLGAVPGADQLTATGMLAPFANVTVTAGAAPVDASAEIPRYMPAVTPATAAA
jgi:hypothetical protein